MPRQPGIPKYRRRKGTNRAVITLRDPLGNRQDVQLGEYNTPESKAEYRRVLAEWDAAGRRLPPTGANSVDRTVNEIMLAFLRHADEHYRRPDGTPTPEANNIRYAIRTVRELYGHTPAASFGPRALRAVREALIDKGLARTVINARSNIVRRVFKWAVSMEMVPSSVLEGLRSVQGLERGRSRARESDPVKPVPDAVVERTLPFLRPPVRAMIQLQRLCGARPGEIMAMRRGEVDASGTVWRYEPAMHKTSHRGRSRTIFFGPKAQSVLAPFLDGLSPDDFVFSPARDAQAILVARRSKRKTPLWPSHIRHQAKKRKPSPQRRPRERFERNTYGWAIYRACDAAFPPPAPLARLKDETKAKWLERLTTEQRDALREWRKAHRWHPNQLRHTHASAVRRQYGLEAAQASLGHAKADVTQLYAARDEALAARVAAEAG